MGCERKIGEIFEDYKKRRRDEALAEKLWHRGRMFFVSSALVKKGDGKTYRATRTFNKKDYYATPIL